VESFLEAAAGLIFVLRFGIPQLVLCLIQLGLEERLNFFRGRACPTELLWFSMGILDGSYHQPKTRSHGLLSLLAAIVQVLTLLLFAIWLQDSYGNFRLRLFPDGVMLAGLEVGVVWLIRVDWRIGNRKP
jgi:hypothetical protein